MPSFKSNADALGRCLTTQLKRQGMPRVVQQLLDAGLPLQAATQLCLWGQKQDHSHESGFQSQTLPPAHASTSSEFDDVGTDLLRPISAVSKLRSIPMTASSRPRSSIGMARDLSVSVDQTASAATAVALPSKKLQSPTASITSSTPTNFIVRSFRDIEHRAQLLHRAKTSAARLNISTQPLVIQMCPPCFLPLPSNAIFSYISRAHQVPVRLRTQGAFHVAPSSPNRHKSPPLNGIGLAGLLSKTADYYSDEGAPGAASLIDITAAACFTLPYPANCCLSDVRI